MLEKLSATKVGVFLGACVLAYTVAVPLVPSNVQDFDKFERVAHALEAYALDNNGDFPLNNNPYLHLPNVLTTPIPYITQEEMIDPLAGTAGGLYRFRYWRTKEQSAAVKAMFGDWLVFSPGFELGASSTYFPSMQPVLYDPTNGTISKGLMLRSQKMQTETGRN